MLQAFSRRYCAYMVLLLFLLVTGCESRPFNYINDPRFHELKDQSFVLHHDLFLAQSFDTKEFVLEPPGLGSSVPRTVKEYEAAPDNWWEIDDYPSSMFQGRRLISDIKAVIPAGTRIKITKIKKVRVGDYKGNYVPYGQIDLPAWKDESVYLNHLFDRERNPYRLIPNPKYLRPVNGSV